jgi:hypothetical protein
VESRKWPCTRWRRGRDCRRRLSPSRGNSFTADRSSERVSRLQWQDGGSDRIRAKPKLETCSKLA